MAAGRLFISRLDEARSPASAGRIIDIKKTPIKTSERAHLSSHSPDGPLSHLSPTRSISTPTATKKAEYKDDSDILEKLCEYLFDLFDANLMEDYIKMEKFEIRALESFQNFTDTEYTHEQHALHNEFVALFEQLVEGFLQSEGYTIDVFYNELAHFLNKSTFKPKGNKGPGMQSSYYNDATPADEVMEVISSYIQFDTWADLMRKQAQQRCEFQSMREKINEVAVSAGNSSASKQGSVLENNDSKQSHK